MKEKTLIKATVMVAVLAVAGIVLVDSSEFLATVTVTLATTLAIYVIVNVVRNHQKEKKLHEKLAGIKRRSAVFLEVGLCGYRYWGEFLQVVLLDRKGNVLFDKYYYNEKDTYNPKEFRECCMEVGLSAEKLSESDDRYIIGEILRKADVIVTVDRFYVKMLHQCGVDVGNTKVISTGSLMGQYDEKHGTQSKEYLANWGYEYDEFLTCDSVGNCRATWRGIKKLAKERKEFEA